MASPNLSEIVTTTHRNRSETLADNVTNHVPLLRYLKKRGNISLKSGGRTLVHELDYAENATFQWYDGYEVLDVSASDVLSAAEFNWKQAAVNVTISGKEMRMNSGDDEIIDLLESRIKNADRTMMNNVATGIASDGTGSSGKQIGGLQLLVPDDPSTGTAGGINRANYSFWQSQVYDATSDGGDTTSATNIQGYMNALWIQCVRNADAPDLIVAGSDKFQYFWNSLQTIQRITGADEGSSGFRTLTYYGPGGSADVVYDSTINADRMYFLNTEYIKFCVHREANFAPLEDKSSVNQDAMVKPIIFMGNLTMSNAARQGVLKE
jgi:hypothetical protein